MSTTSIERESRVLSVAFVFTPFGQGEGMGLESKGCGVCVVDQWRPNYKGRATNRICTQSDYKMVSVTSSGNI